MDSNLRNPNNPSENGAEHIFGLSGLPTVSFQLDGMISAGAYTPEASDDGATWYAIPAIAADGTILSAISAAGLYRCDVNGYQMWHLKASAGFAGVCSVQSFASPLPM